MDAKMKMALEVIRAKATGSAAAAREGSSKVQDDVLRNTYLVFAEAMESLASEAATATVSE